MPTTFDAPVALLFWVTLTGMLPALRDITGNDVLSWVILPNCAYVLVAAACRVRFGTGTDMSVSWAVLYLSVAACAVLITLSALYGHARFVDALLAITMSAYVYITAPAWRTGVPPVAAAKHKEHSA